MNIKISQIQKTQNDLHFTCLNDNWGLWEEQMTHILSRVMAVMDNVETNTDTDPNIGNILHKAGSGAQGQ